VGASWQVQLTRKWRPLRARTSGNHENLAATGVGWTFTGDAYPRDRDAILGEVVLQLSNADRLLHARARMLRLPNRKGCR
jgi:hypothetical protein